MIKALKSMKPILASLFILLAGLLCYSPSYVEESVNEKTEQVEEAFVIVAKKQKQEAVKRTRHHYTTYTSVFEFNKGEPLSAVRPVAKRFILYRSLRFCD